MAMSFDPFSELDRLTGALLQFRPGPRFMPVDLYRNEEQYVLVADLPGIDPGSVDVDVDGQLLTIRAERTEGIHDSVAPTTTTVFSPSLSLSPSELSHGRSRSQPDTNCSRNLQKR